MPRRGFHFSETGPLTGHALFKLEWQGINSGILTIEGSPVSLQYDDHQISQLRIRAAALLLSDGVEQFDFENAQLFIARDGVKIGIELRTTERVFRRTNLSLADFAMCVQELFPVRIDHASNTHTGYVVSAPHAPSETGTARIARKISETCSIGLVTAWGFRDRGDKYIPHPIGRCINVNRPTEFVQHSVNRQTTEIVTTRAESAFQQYVAALQQAAESEILELLVECHGCYQKSVSQIEIAQIGFTHHQAERIVNRLSKSWAGIANVLIEPLSPLRYTASSAKSTGILTTKFCKRALHIELPRIARMQENRDRMAEGIAEIIEMCKSSQL